MGEKRWIGLEGFEALYNPEFFEHEYLTDDEVVI